jgi:disulfide bond formation protein DsbB
LSRVTRLDQARWLALLVPAALLAGAYGSQYWGGLIPCDMCWWQRYAHFAALLLAVLAIAAARLGPVRGRVLVWLAVLAIAVSGAIGFYQAGVEAGLLEGLTQCTAASSGLSADALLKQIMDAPMVRCDQVQWSWLGISMAGWNGIVSIGAALVITWLSLRSRSMRA